VLYLVFVLLLIRKHGIIDQLEALKYTNAAAQLASGKFNFPFGPMTPFSSYIFFLVPAALLGNIHYAILFQILLTIAAANCLSIICEKTTRSRLAGIFAMAVFLLNYFIQFWTISLFSESFFISLSIFLIYGTLQWKPSLKYLMILSLVGLVVLFARPQGVLFVLPCLLYYLGKNDRFRKYLSNSLFAIAAVLILIFSFTRSTDCENIFKPIAESSIICGFPQTIFQEPFPERCTILKAHEYLIEKHGILHEFQLFFQKTISLFSFTRPYYSAKHNLLIGVNYLLLILSLIPLLIKSNAPKEISLFFKIILLNILLIGLTYDEWHGRYLAVIMPLLILLSAISIVPAIGFFRKKSEKPS